jgi:hypothetical protein
MSDWYFPSSAVTSDPMAKAGPLEGITAASAVGLADVTGVEYVAVGDMLGYTNCQRTTEPRFYPSVI